MDYHLRSDIGVISIVPTMPNLSDECQKPVVFVNVRGDYQQVRVSTLADAEAVAKFLAEYTPLVEQQVRAGLCQQLKDLLGFDR